MYITKIYLNHYLIFILIVVISIWNVYRFTIQSICSEIGTFK